MSKLVISGIGHDRPGIVAAIGKILDEFGCNIEDSTMTRLAQEFAMILIVNLPDEKNLPRMREACSRLETSHGLTVLLKPLEPNVALHSHVPGNPYMVSVAGNDRTGITFQVAEALAALDVNITDLNAQLIEGEDGPVYIMMVEVDMPAQRAEADVREALDLLAGRLGLEIQLRPLESVAL